MVVITVELTALKRRLRQEIVNGRYYPLIRVKDLSGRLLLDAVLHYTGGKATDDPIVPHDTIKPVATRCGWSMTKPRRRAKMISTTAKRAPINWTERQELTIGEPRLPNELLIHEVLQWLSFRDLFSFLCVNRTAFLLGCTSRVITDRIKHSTHQDLQRTLIDAAFGRNVNLLRLTIRSGRIIDQRTAIGLIDIYNAVGSPQGTDRAHYVFDSKTTSLWRESVPLSPYRIQAIKQIVSGAADNADITTELDNHLNLFVGQIDVVSYVVGRILYRLVNPQTVRLIVRMQERPNKMVNRYSSWIARIAIERDDLTILRVLCEQSALSKYPDEHSSLIKTIRTYGDHSLITRLNSASITASQELVFKYHDPKLWKTQWESTTVLGYKRTMLLYAASALTPTEAFSYAKTVLDLMPEITTEMITLARSSLGYTVWSLEFERLVKEETRLAT